MKINLFQERLSVDNKRLEHKAIFLCPRGNIYHHGPDTCILVANTLHTQHLSECGSPTSPAPQSILFTI